MQKLGILVAFITDDALKVLGFLMASLLAFLTPIIDLLLFTGFVIALDLLTGVWASRKRKEEFESKKLQRSWAKTILYPLGIIFSFYAEKLIPEIPFVKGAAFLLVVIEGISLEENFSDILGYSLMKYIKLFVMKGKVQAFKEINEDIENKKKQQ